MKIASQNSPELIQLGKLIENISVAMLTSLDNEGKLLSRPMSPLEMDRQGALWFFTALAADKADHLHTLNLSFTDPQHGIYVSLSGHGELQTDIEHIRRLWSPLARPWFPDGPDAGNLALLKFVPDSAEYWDAPHGKMLRMFAMVASIAASRPVDMDDNDRFTHLTPILPSIH